MAQMGCAQVPCDLIVIGGGIVGTAAALSLAEAYPGLKISVLEKEARLAGHQSGHNSGVIHSGLYYEPGSLKARCCSAGREALYRFCREQAIPFRKCGKVVVATRESEIAALDELERRGLANGLDGITRLDRIQVLAHEPHVAALQGLYVPQTGVVDFVRVTEAFASCLGERGGRVLTGCRVDRIQRVAGSLLLHTSQGKIATRYVVNCAGLYSDRVARMCGVEPGVRIIPFRGEYYHITQPGSRLVSGLVYPVPDPQFPFLGLHFTRTITGDLVAGPNAILALKREGYGRFSFSAQDMIDNLTYPGFWHMTKRFWRTGMAEYVRSFRKNCIVAVLRQMVPELRSGDVIRGGVGIRAQAVDPAGNLVDDFRLLEAEGMLHLVNAPSPAATAALSIGRLIAERAGIVFNL